MPILDERDLIQVDATAIAGVLILLTLTSITTDNSQIKFTYSLFLGSFIVAAIVPFSISAILILKGNFHPRQRAISVLRVA